MHFPYLLQVRHSSVSQKVTEYINLRRCANVHNERKKKRETPPNQRYMLYRGVSKHIMDYLVTRSCVMHVYIVNGFIYLDIAYSIVVRGYIRNRANIYVL